MGLSSKGVYPLRSSCYRRSFADSVPELPVFASVLELLAVSVPELLAVPVPELLAVPVPELPSVSVAELLAVPVLVLPVEYSVLVLGDYYGYRRRTAVAHSCSLGRGWLVFRPRGLYCVGPG